MKKEIIKFLIIGIGNTLLGLTCIFLFYNLFGLGYWLSSCLGYIVGSIWSYYMNKYITFQYKTKNHLTIIRFFANVVICYIIAYLIAKPLTRQIFSTIFANISESVVEEMAMLVGMGIYTFLNFLGQKFFVFFMHHK